MINIQSLQYLLLKISTANRTISKEAISTVFPPYTGNLRVSHHMPILKIEIFNRLRYEKTISDHERMIASLEENIRASRVDMDEKTRQYEIQV